MRRLAGDIAEAASILSTSSLSDQEKERRIRAAALVASRSLAAALGRIVVVVFMTALPAIAAHATGLADGTAVWWLALEPFTMFATIIGVFALAWLRHRLLRTRAAPPPELAERPMTGLDAARALHAELKEQAVLPA